MPPTHVMHRPRPTQAVAVEVVLQPPLLNRAVMAYFRPQQTAAADDDWTCLPEIPAASELLAAEPSEQESRLLPNKRRGAQEQGEYIIQKPEPATDNYTATYLQQQYEFLREEAVRPLRKAVFLVKNIPNADEDSLQNAASIYEKVHIIGYLASTRGIAVRITFNTRRAGKKILWERSKRLMTGSLVVLTPSNDMFRKKTVVATVAARPLSGLQADPPELELFFAHSEELEIDPSIEWTMVEARSSFFEAERYTMLALQKLASERFPLARQITELNKNSDPPDYLANALLHDFTAIFDDLPPICDANAITSWPQSQNTSLDESQQEAVQRIFSNSIAIIQGPPGTGKTFVSVRAIHALLDNAKDGPPIIVTAQTNHALDQLLQHIAEFEPEFIRLGGRSKDKDVILNRTLYEVRKKTDRVLLPGCSAPGARKDMRRLDGIMEELMKPLAKSTKALDPWILKKHGLLTATQAESVEKGASAWVQAKLVVTQESPFQLWAKRSMIKVDYKPQPEDYGFDFEEEELEFEDLQDVEAENAVKDDDFVDALKGSSYTLADNYTCPQEQGVTSKIIDKLLRENEDLWQIPEAFRSAVYRHLQSRLKQILVEQFRELAKQYDAASKLHRIGQWEQDELILRKQRIIGCTTTGLSKYRGLIASLGCRIVLVEEAAETLEAPVVAACLPTLQHLILVGDHKQLRPHCRIRQHEKLKYNISMFERLVDNDIGHTTLTKQRRMIPEIRRLLRPIYKDVIKDHDFVKLPTNRPDVPGMGGINSYFFTHSWKEQRDDLMSCINKDEAAMIIGLATYLVQNGMSGADITILTFYNGQRKKLVQLMRKSTVLRTAPCEIVTVDSYQGEENKVVILSLVRSNQTNAIGFLANDNRVCVALSRAQQGLYIFGNAMNLNEYPTWQKILRIIVGRDEKHPEELPKFEPQRFHEKLPITCSNHSITTHIESPEDWDGLAGGCRQLCDHIYACGHHCTAACHPSGHELLACTGPCARILSCGHQCTLPCGQVCVCQTCAKTETRNRMLKGTRGGSESSASSSSQVWQTYAKQEHERYEQACQTPPVSLPNTPPKSTSGSPLKQELLIEI